MATVFAREAKRISDDLAAELKLLIGILSEVQCDEIVSAADAVFQTVRRDKTVFLMGNGGSASTAEHLSNDLMRIFLNAGRQCKARCLASNISIMTALANDFNYSALFRKQLELEASPGDLIIAISVSGKSQNCLEALRYANSMGYKTLGLLGSDGGICKHMCEISLHVPNDDFMLVENMHLILCHAIARAVERLLRQSPQEASTALN